MLDPINVNNENYCPSFCQTACEWGGWIISTLLCFPSALLSKIGSLFDCCSPKAEEPKKNLKKRQIKKKPPEENKVPIPGKKIGPKKTQSTTPEKTKDAELLSKIKACVMILDEIKSIEDLKGKTEQLQKQLDAILEKDVNEETIFIVQDLQSNFIALKNALNEKPSPAYVTPDDYSKLKVKEDGTVTVTGDGNCLYYSVSALLHFEKKVCNQSTLRKQVADYMTNNVGSDDTLKLLIETDISTYNEDLYKDAVALKELYEAGETDLTESEYQDLMKKHKKDAQKNKITSISHYIQSSGQDKFWSGTSHVYTIATLLNRPINVIYFFDTRRERTDTWNPTNSRLEPLTIAHVGSGTHFEPKIF